MRWQKEFYNFSLDAGHKVIYKTGSYINLRGWTDNTCYIIRPHKPGKISLVLPHPESMAGGKKIHVIIPKGAVAVILNEKFQREGMFEKSKGMLEITHDGTAWDMSIMEIAEADSLQPGEELVGEL